MSEIYGHMRMTEEAIRRLRTQCGNNAVAQLLPEPRTGAPARHRLLPHFVERHVLNDAKTVVVTGASYTLRTLYGESDPSVFAVLIDVRDLITRDHWSDAGQRHHFMRAKSEAVTDAFNNAVNWINQHAQSAANEIANKLLYQLANHSEVSRLATSSSLKPDACHIAGVQRMSFSWDSLKRGASNSILDTNSSVLNNKAAQGIGIAAHCVQDSFSSSHVQRANKIGVIEDLYIYEHEPGGINHDEHDELWWQAGAGFSPAAEAAIAATMDLFTVILNTALARSTSLVGFQNFCTVHLPFSPKQ